MIRPHVVFAIFWRNLSSYFSSIIGYLFIVVFVVAGAIFAFSPRFFAENQATLDQLTTYIPYLLLFLIPAISMGSWSDESRQGTDELLFTLPATDLEILLGKFKAVFAVYTVALLFSFSHALVLMLLGKPDIGILITTYIGYWLAGYALIAASMYASSLTTNNTVAFVLGGIFCAIPIFASEVVNGVAGIISAFMANRNFGQGIMDAILPRLGLLKTLSLPEQLGYFAKGLIYFSSVVYFFAVNFFFLYLNYVRIGRRHWNNTKGMPLEVQHFLRALSVIVVLICVTSWFWDSPRRLDLTSESFYSLSPKSREVLNGIEDNQQITIQAFVSEEVPSEFINIKKNVLGLLKEFDAYGGRNVELRLVNVKPFSKETEEARKLGITPKTVSTEVDGEFVALDTFLGAVITSNYDEIAIPFFDRGVKIEYELTRAIGSVSDEEKPTIGVLTTDAKVMGGLDMSTFQNTPEWKIVTELKKQYKVVEVSPDSPISEDEFDCLFAVLPSSLTQPQMDNLYNYVTNGNPTLIFDDPLPIFNPGLAPREPKPRQGGNNMFGGGGPPPEQKADNGTARRLMTAIGLGWNINDILFDRETPEPKYANVAPPELVFISEKANFKNAISNSSEITSGMQLLLTYYAGQVNYNEQSPYKYTDLFSTGSKNSGVHDYDNLLRPGFMGRVSLSPNPDYNTDEHFHRIATLIETKVDKAPRNVIFVADTDMITDNVLRITEQELYGLKIDNIVFTLNSIDYLIGKKDYIPLRKKRPLDRKLDTIAKEITEFVKKRETVKEEAKKESKKRIEEFKEALQEESEKIRNDETLNPINKQIQLSNFAEEQEKKLILKTKQLSEEMTQKVNEATASSERNIRSIKERVRLMATIFSCLPAILFGTIILSIRFSQERSHVQEDRRRK